MQGPVAQKSVGVAASLDFQVQDDVKFWICLVPVSPIISLEVVSLESQSRPVLMHDAGLQVSLPCLESGVRGSRFFLVGALGVSACRPVSRLRFRARA